MKKLGKLTCLIIVFVSVMAVLCTGSIAANIKYTENLIPAMTSNTAPAGIVSASSYHLSNATNTPYLAFNHTSWDSWVTADGYNTGWLCYKFDSKKRIERYGLLSEVSWPNRAPKNWTFEGSNDGVTWTVLDSRSSVTAWSDNVRKVFDFNNSDYYFYYRINISANNGDSLLGMAELEMMESLTPSMPAQLIAAAGNSQVTLNWLKVEGAGSYIVKRSETAGGPYNTTFAATATTYTDISAKNGTTYYYVVSAVNANGESYDSNEAYATPSAPANSGIVELTMLTGEIKEYDMTGAELQSFLAWYENRSEGAGKAYYTIVKKNNIKPFLNRKEYIPFDKISSFEVKEYAE